jgi:hypothetical protein
VNAGDKETKGVLPVRTPALHLAGIGISIALWWNGPDFVRIGLPEWNLVTSIRWRFLRTLCWAAFQRPQRASIDLSFGDSLVAGSAANRCETKFGISLYRPWVVDVDGQLGRSRTSRLHPTHSLNHKR